MNEAVFNLEKWLRQEGLSTYLDKADELNIEIIYSMIDRKEGKPAFTTYNFNPHNRYHYPASTVKLPVAVLALEFLNTLKQKGIDANTTMYTDAIRQGEEDRLIDESAADGRPTIAHYIKKILLVSDNDAYNRLYELLGQETINNRLHQLGFTGAEIIHRLSVSLTEAENRRSNPVRFVDASGNTLLTKPEIFSAYKYANRNEKVGTGYMQGDSLVNRPLDFSKKNRWPLAYHHQLVQWIMFPETQPVNNKLLLSTDDYAFLRKFMAMLPGESSDPVYKQPDYWPAYVKFLLYGSEREARIPNNIHIYNKVGDAYGFLIDGAYITDTVKNIDFLLSARIYCNADGILNDDKYDYDAVGFPFMKKLGEAIMKYEALRNKN